MWYSYKAYFDEKYMFSGTVDADSEELAQEKLTKMHGYIYTFKIKLVK